MCNVSRNGATCPTQVASLRRPSPGQVRDPSRPKAAMGNHAGLARNDRRCSGIEPLTCTLTLRGKRDRKWLRRHWTALSTRCCRSGRDLHMIVIKLRLVTPWFAVLLDRRRYWTA
jgi:hypothetical protein